MAIASSHKEDQELITLINGGDREAFTKLVHHYTKRLYYYAWQFLGDKHMAEDIVQDLYMEIWNKRTSWHPSETLHGYLLKSIKNRCLRYLEKQRPTPGSNVLQASVDGAQDIVNIFADAQSAARVENSILEKEIIDALQSLPERCGLIFRMHRFEGMSQKQIAKELNISLKTVGNQVQRAVELLYKKLHQHIEP